MLTKFLNKLIILLNISKNTFTENLVSESKNNMKNIENPVKEKAMFRKMMKSRLSEYTQNFLKIKKNAESAFLIFTQSDLYRESRTILAFISMELEMETREVIKKALADGKRVAVPRTIPETCGMDFYFLSPKTSLESQLEKSEYGILEPKTDLEKLEPERLPIHTVLLVPGLAYGKDGARLGHGKGFYDRYIEKLYAQKSEIHLPVALVGWGFSMQVFDEVPIEDHDFMLTHIVTEKGIMLCK